VRQPEVCVLDHVRQKLTVDAITEGGMLPRSIGKIGIDVISITFFHQLLTLLEQEID
jgi:hypothetical protein